MARKSSATASRTGTRTTLRIWEKATRFFSRWTAVAHARTISAQRLREMAEIIQNNYGDIKLSKKHKDDTERIDPVAAVMNALARALVRRENPTLADVIASGRFSM